MGAIQEGRRIGSGDIFEAMLQDARSRGADGLPPKIGSQSHQILLCRILVLAHSLSSLKVTGECLFQNRGQTEIAIIEWGSQVGTRGT